MSTRSGKRLHNSFQENTSTPEFDKIVQSERKTRSRRLKEIVDESVILVKNKIRANYVSYPSEEDPGLENYVKTNRVPRKNVLKEHNITAITDGDELPNHVKKVSRTTRSTCKYGEANLDGQENQNHVEEDNVNSTKKSKKRKKKQDEAEQSVQTSISIKKTKKKKGKKGKRSGSMIIEEIEPRESSIVLNKSNVSNDSFHSATGSPKKIHDVPVTVVQSPEQDVKHNSTLEKEGRKTRSSMRVSNSDIFTKTPVKENLKRKSSIKDDCSEQTVSSKDGVQLDNSTNTSLKAKKRKINVKAENKANTSEIKTNDSTLNMEDSKKSLVNTTFDKKETNELNTTYDNTEIETKIVNTTFDKVDDVPKLNTTFDKDTDKTLTSEANLILPKSGIDTIFETSINTSQTDVKIKTSCENMNETASIRQSSIKDATFDKDIVDLPSETSDDKINQRKSVLSQKLSTELNSTYDKSDKCDSTFDKEKKLDGTFDKNSKSSLLSSDNSDITMDKSDVSRISITSDDSKDNIVNMTPVLVESSLDESQINDTKPGQLEPLTPLQREGTFTKEDTKHPELVKTPTKHMSLSSPGCTPFHVVNSTSNEKSQLNVTKSIEKIRRSSLAEPPPRATKVMFCSPVNNPLAVMQQRKKVIKSNLKGSNKSFVYEDNEAPSRPARRKRSYTHGDAEDACVKRTRLAEGMQHSTNRLSRTRTASASAKLTEASTPSKKAATPKKEAKISRTKLPNFAALHQRQFSKMESLDECQERRARRAKLLLTPTGGVDMLERISPKESAPDPTKSPRLPKKEQKDQKLDKKTTGTKPTTPVKSLPSLKSLNPGYNKFGFRLNLDTNPFSMPSTSESSNRCNIFNFESKKMSTPATATLSSKKRDNTKSLKDLKAIRPTLSLAGTSVRKEVAKRSVSKRIDKRNMKRDETRTVIKGVRTNRRFDLLMSMRNLE